MKKKSTFFGIILLSILFISTYISNVAAAESWAVSEDQKLIYTFDKKSGESGLLAKQDKLCSGIISLKIEDIDTNGVVTATCDTGFSGTEAIDIRDDMEFTDKVFSGNKISLTYGNIISPLIYSETGFQSAPTDWNNLLDLWEIFVAIFIVNGTFTKGEMSETQYEATITVENSTVESYVKGVYSTDGILKSYTYYAIDKDGIKTQYILNKNIINLPYPNLYIYAAAGGAALILVVIMCCCCRKKKK